MKYTRRHFSEDTYRLWEKGVTLPVPENSRSYVVKYRIDEEQYSVIEINASNINEALEQACFQVAKKFAIFPEDVDLHSIYDIDGKLLWGDGLPFGLSRREFLTALGLAKAALLFGLPRVAKGATTSVSLAGSASLFPSFTDDVFSTYLYTGNGGTQTINNGIDLAGKGGLVWIKSRNDSTYGVNNLHTLYDTARGTGNGYLNTSSTAVSNSNGGPDAFDAFTSNGFSLDGSVFVGAQAGAISNNGGQNYVSWTFRKAAKFFDCGTFVAGSDSNRRISHSLGIAPGLVVVKHTTTTSGWYTYHRSTGRTGLHNLNSTAAVNGSQAWWGASDPTSTDFGVNEAQLFSSGQTVVWYAWAHDPSVQGVIQCGTYLGNGSNDGPLVDLGWEPQYVFVKCSSFSDVNTHWVVQDLLRGMPWSGGAGQTIYLNSTGAEFNNYAVSPTSRGFKINGTGGGSNQSGQSYIYCAIRRPNKPPTSGTQVYNAITYTGNGGAGRYLSGVGFTPDTAIVCERGRSGIPHLFFDRMRDNRELDATTSASEGANGFASLSNQDGIVLNTSGFGNASGMSYISYFFRRAPGFFDVIIPNGATSGTIEHTHNLGAAPELVIFKARTVVQDWFVEGNVVGQGYQCYLNLPNGRGATSYISSPTSATFTTAGLNPTAYVFYLFSSLPGISKVASYTGNGTSQTINCGFTTGARFLLIKRTDNLGNWYLWDSARGIVTGNDTYLNLNTTAAEVASDDSVDPDSSGFIVNQVVATNINVTGATYIFLAIA